MRPAEASSREVPNINNVPYNSLPVGIGPFKYLRWDRAQDVIMVANPLYWRGPPKLQKVIYKIIPDRNTLLSQLQAHEVDMWNSSLRLSFRAYKASRDSR